MTRKTLVVFFLLSVALGASAATYRVATAGSTPAGSDANAGTAEAPFLSISNALAHASAEGGDTILVGPGVYKVAAQLEVAKPVTLQSTAGRSATTIQQTNFVSSGESRVLLINHAGAKVSGFTITGGNCTVEDKNHVTGAGAGVKIGTNGGWLADCLVIGNTNCWASQVENAGGGVAMFGASAVVTNCEISANCLRNAWVAYAAGIYATGGTIVDSTISGNVNNGHYGRGGGLAFAGAVTMRRCKVAGNTCPKATYTGWGGWGEPAGLYILSAATGSLVENCLIAENATASNGGGLCVEAVADIVNCTIAGNTAMYGGGVWCRAAARFRNCIIQGNAATSDTTAGAPEWNGSQALYSHSLSPVALPTANGANVTATAAFKAGTYKLKGGSPGYNAGSTNGYAWLASTLDLDGDARVWGEAIDTGCYEYATDGLDVSMTASAEKIVLGSAATYAALVIDGQQKGYTLAWHVDGAQNPASTAQAFTNVFQTTGWHSVSLTVTSLGDQTSQTVSERIHVLSPVLCVVHPDAHPGHAPAAPYDSEANAFTNIQDAIDLAMEGVLVRVYGGAYLVTNQVSLEKAVRVTGVGGPSATSVRNTSGKGRAFYVNHGGARLDGFSASGTTWNARNADGIGLNMGALGGLVSNCVFYGNSSKTDMNTYGGGVSLSGGEIVDCAIAGNRITTSYSGATYAISGGGGAKLSAAVMRNCAVVSNSLVHPNTPASVQPGGGICAYGGSVIVGCLVAGNSCEGLGGGIYAEGGATVSNCTVAANASTRDGGGLYAYGGTPRLVNTAFAGNSAAGAGASACVTNTAALVVSHCFAPEGAIPEGDGSNLNGTEPKFRDAAAFDFQLLSRSPLRNAGAYAAWMDGATDLARNPRVDVGQKVDIGCYECHRPLGLLLEIR